MPNGAVGYIQGYRFYLLNQMGLYLSTVEAGPPASCFPFRSMPVFEGRFFNIPNGWLLFAFHSIAGAGRDESLVGPLMQKGIL
ncbi:hypothetical protein IEN85_02340 [Pelagicoccus sp. NFK12]|uniref:Uncharacterized protein n=1 Tax=Pelagicoccus enzymogenes TaxID=2773457 RepID=A0A927F5C0_9BACT|nr:hypothetical protein [Pelagicoccus enzymogenes]MBD5778330.1 hypothetical protein [Pelagicoccus enzymogenes]